MASNQAPVVDRIRIIPRPDDFLDRNVGSSGEVFFNKATNSLRVYSGALAGGYELVTSDLANVTNDALLTKASTAGLAKTDLTNITDSDFLTKANQAGITASAGASIDVSESAPITPSQGNIWLNSNTGALYVYITDVDGSQWIQPVVGVTTGGGGGTSYTDSDVDNHLNTSGASSGQILSWNGADYAWVTDQTGGGGGGGGIALTDLSVTAEGTPSGDGELSYNSGTGAFTFTPPDLTSYVTASSSTAFTNKTGNISQWTNDSNYITTYTETDTLDSVTDRGATTSNNVTVGDITANAYINAGTGSPTFSSASSITLTAPDGVISNGVFAPMYTGLVKGSSGTVTVIGQGVSTTSVADNGLGDYTLTFSSPLAADTDSFGLIGSVQNQSISATVSFVKTSTTVIQIYVHEASGTNIDADVFLTIYEI